MIAALIVGIVTAIHDGDTFSIGKQRIRVFGIDAPELHQQCSPAPGQCSPCGEAAREALSAMILGKEVRCADRGRSYDRVVAECIVDGAAIGPAMVAQGQAVVYRQFLKKADKPAYLGAEAGAKRAGEGLWAMTWVPPADWRKHRARLECER
jgi:Micrococcal nuclease (thermonuclease) homologs